MSQDIKIGSNRSFGVVFFIVFFIVAIYPLINGGILEFGVNNKPYIFKFGIN